MECCYTVLLDDQEVMEVTFSDGNKVKCTPYHNFLQNGYKGGKKLY